MQNINTYDAERFEKEFKAQEIYKKLADQYDIVSFEKFTENIVEKIATPRQQMSTSIVSAVPWYYLSRLDVNHTMYDLGCGYNFFKPYFPRLIGLSPDIGSTYFGDQHDYIDDDFFANHRGVFDSVFSINALHFRPLETLPKLLNDFVSMLKPNGKGFLALNSDRMLDCSKSFKDWSDDRLQDWIGEQFDSLLCDILILDVDLSKKNAWLDGNIRAVFANTKRAA